MSMSVSGLSASTQDYLKAVASLAEWSQEPVTPTRLATRMGLKISTVSDAVRKLSAQGLLTHAPYGAITLTDTGRAYATEMIRRHRLLETFLVEVLGYSWDEVHDEAENLEHAVSDLLVERIDALLKHPSVDPHGDPIPSAQGESEVVEALPLSTIPAGQRVVIRRIDDSNAELLKFFEAHGIGVGVHLELSEGAPFSDSMNVQILENSGDGGETSPNIAGNVALGKAALANLFVAEVL